MTAVQREAHAFLAQFHHRPFTVTDLEKALQEQGFSLVEFSRLSNCKEVGTLLTSLQLVNYASGLSAFTYQDANLRIVFLQENLSQHEQMILLSHELGHILCGHLEPGPATTGPGSRHFGGAGGQRLLRPAHALQRDLPAPAHGHAHSSVPGRCWCWRLW